MNKINITIPYIDRDEIKEVTDTLSSGWLVQGPKVAKFENLFAQYVGSKYAIATTSCTTALHLALLTLGIGLGDKVVVPAFTFVATANAVRYTGAEVIFCDIDLRTFNIDVKKLEKILEQDFKTEKKIKAVIPVNLFGLCADLPRIKELANVYNLKIIEDSACGVGASINGKHSGTFGDIGCFSFHPRKSITTGEGGMIVTDNEEIDKIVRSLRDHGASKSDYQRHFEIGGSLLPEYNVLGYNYRMTDLQGAIGICQMKKLDYILEQKTKIASLYFERLKEIPFLSPPYISEGYIHGFQSFVCLYVGKNENFFEGNFDKGKIDRLNKIRNNLMLRLEEIGISTRQGTHAVHTLGYYRHKYKLKEEDFINSYAADRLSIALPLYVGMTQEEIDNIIKELTRCVE